MPHRDNLLSIGEFSKVTGIGIHSLRYYDEIGALKPAYVDPVSNYRYYTFDQLGTIPAINICKDAGINLSDFGDFLDNGKINYEKLLGDSRGAIDKKIDEYRRRQNDLSKIEFYLKNEDYIRAGEGITLHLENFEVWTSPISNEQSVSKYDAEELLISLSKDAGRHGCRISPMCYGFMEIVADGTLSTFAFAYIIEKKEDLVDSHNIVRLSDGDYSVCGISELSIDAAKAAFSDMLKDRKDYALLSLNAAFETTGAPLYCAVVSM